MTTKDFAKVGDPIYNASGEQVAEVSSIDEHCLGIKKLEGKEWTEPLQGESVLLDGKKVSWNVPETKIATRIYADGE